MRLLRVFQLLGGVPGPVGMVCADSFRTAPRTVIWLVFDTCQDEAVSSPATAGSPASPARRRSPTASAAPKPVRTPISRSASLVVIDIPWFPHRRDASRAPGRR
jgi:hypothetical protein